MSKKRPSLDEEAALYARWDRGTFRTVEESVDYHHLKHGRGLSRWEYLRKAAAFDKTGARQSLTGNATTYRHRNGAFLIEAGGKILSYGTPTN